MNTSKHSQNLSKMKKALCALMLMLMASAPLFAQLRHEQQSQIGIKAGATFSTLDDGIDRMEGVEEAWVPRLTVGLATSFWSARWDWFAFAPEINFSQRGYTAVVSNVSGPQSTYTYRYNFAEVPLLFRATFGREILRGYVNLGPSVSYLINGKEISEIGGVTTEKKIEAEDNRYNYFEVGGAVGGGLHINTGIGSFLIDLRYHTGFTSMYTKEMKDLIPYGPTQEQPDKYRTRYISTSLIFLGPYRK